MLIRRPTGLTDNDVTDSRLVSERRRFIQRIGLTLGVACVHPVAFAATGCESAIDLADENQQPNSLREIGSYNNYYEFSRNKEAVRILAQELTTEPWTLTIEGEVENPITLDLDDIRHRFDSEQRIYRLRCVEGWSMVIPWDGVPLCKLLQLAAPTSHARYVQFVSLLRPSEMINQRLDILEWPYREGLRLDEAMNPLTLLATGMFGDEMPKQNGAPLRVVVPWKYGYKSPKAVTHIRLMRERPSTSWNQAAPSEYGFLANVDPKAPHPRWNQRRENRIGELRKRRTLPFNGYAEHVAHLYSGIDLD